jgi:uncharacterized membrane protein HdeD (DUF308 family)
MSTRDQWMMLARSALSFGFSGMLIGREIRLLTDFGVIWGIYAVLDGLLAIAIALPPIGRNERRAVFFAQGVVGVAAGVTAMLVPRVWSFLIAAGIPIWAIVHAALTFIGAVSIRETIAPTWLIASAGVVTLTLAVLFLSNPEGGLPWLTSLMAAYGLAHGVLLLALAPGVVRPTGT